MSEYQVGDRVRITDAAPPGHLRTPQFVRGRTGVIARHFGAFPNPERLAYGMTGLPKLNLYQVVFAMDEVWQGEGRYGPADTVAADIYEHWLEPASDTR